MRFIRFFLLVVLAAISSFAQSGTLSTVVIPKVINFSGTAPVGTSSATFAIYDSQDAAAPLWLETQTITTDSNGHYTTVLGSTSAEGLPAEIFATTAARWIGVKVGDAPESARMLLVSVPYALKAGDAETLGGKPLSAFVMADANAVTVSATSGKAQRLRSNAETGKASPEPAAPGDSGTPAHLAKFASDGVTLNDSALVEIGGRLGIGTTSPNFPLELVGSNVELLQRNPNPSSYAGMRFYNDQNSALHALEIDYSGSAYPGTLTGAGPVGEQTSITNNGPFPMTFGTNNTARITIAGGGNVGIGTNSPSFPLELVGSNVAFLQRNPNAASYTGMRFYNDQNNALRALEIDYSGSSFSGALIAGGPSGEQTSITNNGPYPMSFGTNNAARVTILGTGEVGVGTITPVAKLDVSQSATGAGSFSVGTPPPSGIHGDTTAASGYIAGVFGSTSSVDGYGILGENLASGTPSNPTLDSAGVRGVSGNMSSGGTGVWGDATELSGDNIGVFGRTASSDPRASGVIGEATSTTGDINGVYGLSHSTSSGTGVFGEVQATSIGSTTAPPAGVYGLADSAGVAGLFDSGGSADILVGRTGTTHVFRVDNTGKVFANGNFQASGADFAESVDVAEQKSAYEPGDVIAIDTTGVRRFTKVSTPYSTLVAGIYSTKPGVLATPHNMDDPRVASAEIPLAVVGIVPCKVTNENGDINTGDLLVSSSTAGYAMKGTDRNKMTGAVVGKALQSMHGRPGMIEVLVSLQ